METMRLTGWIYFALGIAGVAVLAAMLRSGRFFASLALSALQGVATFFAVNFVGSFFGVELPLNLPSLLLSALGGAPGVIVLLLLQALCAAV